MLKSWERFSYFLILHHQARTECRCSLMTRNTPEILPYCQHCGKYKGVGICSNPKCDKSKQANPWSFREQFDDCVICSNDKVSSCYRCGRSYCILHATGKEESKLRNLDQHLGTCIICGKVICERCWILDNRGFVTCLAHRESNDNV